MQPQPPGPTEPLRRLLNALIRAAAVRLNYAKGQAIPNSVIGFVGIRLCNMRLFIDRIAEMIREGTYAPRPRKPSESAEPRKTPEQKPKPHGWVPQKFGWFAALLGDDAAAFRGALRDALRDPEVMKLIAAAPVTLGRPLRSLCWMLKFTPPEVLAPPKRPRKPRPEKAKPEPEPPLDWDWNSRLSPEARANVPHADPLIYRMGIPGVRRPKGTRRGPPKMA
jgi:hypothetical protein